MCTKSYTTIAHNAPDATRLRVYVHATFADAEHASARAHTPTHVGVNGKSMWDPLVRLRT